MYLERLEPAGDSVPRAPCKGTSPLDPFFENRVCGFQVKFFVELFLVVKSAVGYFQLGRFARNGENELLSVFPYDFFLENGVAVTVCD